MEFQWNLIWNVYHIILIYQIFRNTAFTFQILIIHLIFRPQTTISTDSEHKLRDWNSYETQPIGHSLIKFRHQNCNKIHTIAPYFIYNIINNKVWIRSWSRSCTRNCIWYTRDGCAANWSLSTRCNLTSSCRGNLTSSDSYNITLMSWYIIFSMAGWYIDIIELVRWLGYISIKYRVCYNNKCGIYLVTNFDFILKINLSKCNLIYLFWGKLNFVRLLQYCINGIVYFLCDSLCIERI